MVLTLNRVMPQTTGYAIRRVTERNGHSDPSLLVELAERAYPPHIREDFASHLQQFLKASYPNLTVDVEPFSEGQILSVIGYDDVQARVEMDIKSGVVRDRQIVIQPSLEKYIASNGTKSIDPRTTMERYKSALEGDLVQE